MENSSINMVYIIALFMALIPYGESLDCSCSPAAATGSATSNGAYTSYNNVSDFTYKSDGDYSYLTYYGSVDSAVPVGLASYPAFRIDYAFDVDYNVVDRDDPSAFHKGAYYYVFCYRSGGFAYPFFDAGTDTGVVNCSSTRFPNAEVSDCCSCCCGSDSGDFVTECDTALNVTNPVNTNCPSPRPDNTACPTTIITTTPGAHGGD